jgi:hypothetical protein
MFGIKNARGFAGQKILAIVRGVDQTVAYRSPIRLGNDYLSGRDHVINLAGGVRPGKRRSLLLNWLLGRGYVGRSRLSFLQVHVDLLRGNRAGSCFSQHVAGVARASFFIYIGQLIGGDVYGRLLATLLLLQEQAGHGLGFV